MGFERVEIRGKGILGRKNKKEKKERYGNKEWLRLADVQEREKDGA